MQFSKHIRETLGLIMPTTFERLTLMTLFTTLKYTLLGFFKISLSHGTLYSK